MYEPELARDIPLRNVLFLDTTHTQQHQKKIDNADSRRSAGTLIEFQA